MPAGADSVDAGSTVMAAGAAGQDQEASGPRNPTSSIPPLPKPVKAASKAEGLSGSEPSNAPSASPHQRPLSPPSASLSPHLPLSHGLLCLSPGVTLSLRSWQ